MCKGVLKHFPVPTNSTAPRSPPRFRNSWIRQCKVHSRRALCWYYRFGSQSYEPLLMPKTMIKLVKIIVDFDKGFIARRKTVKIKFLYMHYTKWKNKCKQLNKFWILNQQCLIYGSLPIHTCTLFPLHVWPKCMHAFCRHTSRYWHNLCTEQLPETSRRQRCPRSTAVVAIHGQNRAVCSSGRRLDNTNICVFVLKFT